MKEVIAKESKKYYWFMLIVGLVLVVSCCIYTYTMPDMRTIWIVFACCWSALNILTLVRICDKRPIIERIDKHLMVRKNLFKTTVIDIGNIKDVTPMKKLLRPTKIEKYGISILANINGVDKKIDCYGVIDAPAVIDKLKALIGKE
ncbi:MAG: hypothetical protein IKC58_02490 [Clostridia bacterium]|nr:hypothetical protein [Clostridia bacterium]MBR2985449.1 hypothetical protein [Clostridia bacterium]